MEEASRWEVVKLPGEKEQAPDRIYLWVVRESHVKIVIPQIL